MLAQSDSSSPWPDVSPRWLVTNGSATVGPVATDLLLRGYLGGRIPEHCQVRQEGWRLWRPLERIREIGALKRSLQGEAVDAPANLREALARLPPSSEAGEVLALALQLAARSLAADAGLLHRRRSPVSLLVTSALVGTSPERLGQVLPESDPAYLRALRGLSLCGSSQAGLAERLVAERLHSEAPIISVVMTPIVARGKLVALLELGRSDHPFRADDGYELAELAAHVAQRLG